MAFLSPLAGEFAKGGAIDEEFEFFCPLCLSPTHGAHSGKLSDALSKAMDIVTSVKNSLNDQSSTPSSQSDALSNDIDHQDMLLQDQHEEAGCMMEDPNEPTFEPARMEKYQGFDTDEVKGLVQKIDDSISYLDHEVRKSIERYGDTDEKATSYPLGVWRRIDRSAKELSGQLWYNVKSTNTCPGHTPLTAALRELLGIRGGQALKIRPGLGSIEYSRVLRSLVSWFVFDVIDDKLHLYESLNMNSMRAMMTAVHNFGNESKGKPLKVKVILTNML
jgi:hypothetical protein